jgi:osmoprotectant transport system ATP-binding protein
VPELTRATGGALPIRLEAVTKRYHGQERPAVDEISVEVPAGQLVILVGPSGCGKTTTMRMINRLIEPTSGHIRIGDQDVGGMSGDDLRRRIGYVNQANGLLPHFTVARNVGLVPRLLKWDKRRIAERVDELLTLVGLDPATYRDRHPRRLSGGQQQRVAVARALAADPGVLLMDEPFSAVDPITRDRLQTELLRIQRTVRKTIIFVTHDIDEAIKLGDRIAIFGDDGRIAQYGTPEQVLSEPASPYVKSFIGAGASLKRLHLLTVNDVSLGQWPVARAGEPAEAVRRRLADDSEHGTLIALDADGRPRAWLYAADVDSAGWERRGDRIGAVIAADTTLHDALDAMLESSAGVAVVCDPGGRYAGVVELDTIMERIRVLRAEAQRRDRDAATLLHAEGEAVGT